MGDRGGTGIREQSNCTASSRCALHYIRQANEGSTEPQFGINSTKLSSALETSLGKFLQEWQIDGMKFEFAGGSQMSTMSPLFLTSISPMMPRNLCKLLNWRKKSGRKFSHQEKK